MPVVACGDCQAAPWCGERLVHLAMTLMVGLRAGAFSLSCIAMSRMTTRPHVLRFPSECRTFRAREVANPSRPHSRSPSYAFACLTLHFPIGVSKKTCLQYLRECSGCETICWLLLMNPRLNSTAVCNHFEVVSCRL